MLKITALLIALLLPITAHAQCGIQTPFTLNSWHDVVQGLQASGIEAGRVNWGPVEQVCMFYRKSSEPNAFNNCRYSKARDSVLFASDRAQCTVEANAAAPDVLSKRRVVETVVESDPSGPVRQYDLSVREATSSELAATRNNFLISCMQSLGWQDANNWMLGKRCN